MYTYIHVYINRKHFIIKLKKLHTQVKMNYYITMKHYIFNIFN